MSWKIGEMIKRTGLSARTLHFYEELGLIGPIERTIAGHRVYRRCDLVRLQQIKALSQLGFQLGQIKPVLTGNRQSLQSTVNQQLAYVKQQRALLGQIEAKLTKLDADLSKADVNATDLDDLLFETLETMTMYEQYFNEKTISAMHAKDHQDEQGRTTTLEQSWKDWCASLQKLIDLGSSPLDPQAQQLMAHWQQMIVQLTDNDPQQLKAFNELFHNEPKARADHGISDAMFEFMAKAGAEHPPH